MSLTIAPSKCSMCGDELADSGQPHPALGWLCTYCAGEAAGLDEGLRLAALEQLDHALAGAVRHLPPGTIHHAVNERLAGRSLGEVGVLAGRLEEAA